jgi:hypothetical protein
MGFTAQQVPTRVLRVDGDYERAFARFSATIRNHVRKSARRGISIRATKDERDIAVYDRLYRDLAERKGWRSIYPLEFSLQLVKLEAACFMVAEYEDRIVGGGLFVRDGDEVVYYVHAAQDTNYAHCFPQVAVLDGAIRWTCENGVPVFNLGMSGGIASLDRFKSFWGADIANNWSFEWHNPVLGRLGTLKAATLRTVNVFKRH